MTVAILTAEWPGQNFKIDPSFLSPKADSEIELGNC